MQVLPDVPPKDRELPPTGPLLPGAEPPAVAGAAGQPMVPMPLGLMLGIASRAEEAGRVDEAEPIAAHLLRAVPEDPRVLHLAGIVAFRTNRRPLAVTLLERAIVKEPHNGLYLRNISEMYRVVGRLGDALAAARRAVDLQPGDAAALQNRAVIHHERGEIELGLACSRRAASLRPDMAGAHFAIAEAQLLRGEYAEGWEEYEWRFRMAGVPPLLPVALQRGRSQWGGSSLGNGRLLLIGDQGFGDVIQFSRYIPWALAKGQPTTLATSNEMAPVMRRMFPDLPIATNWADCTMFAAYCPLSGLPRLHGTRLDTILPPLPIPVDPERGALWRTKLDLAIPAGLRRVGIVWAGRPTHRNDRNRSMALSTLAPPLAQVPGIALVSLQKGDATAEVRAYSGRASLADAARDIADYEDTVAAIAALDLVVTVDTSIAHIAGAMGRPCWVLLPFTSDWRWLRERSDSPWYPSLRLFRQQAPGRWDEPLAAVAAELAR
jgi:Flp pilus assembly protein TadD